jgi:hypothetical protein
MCQALINPSLLAIFTSKGTKEQTIILGQKRVSLIPGNGVTDGTEPMQEMS